jgi:hypothetical protein
MSTQYRLVQSGKTASGGCSAGQGSSEPVAPRIIIITHEVQIRLRNTAIEVKKWWICTSATPYTFMLWRNLNYDYELASQWLLG